MAGKRPSTIAAATSAAAVISHNDDLLMEVLLLLPAKSLIRFKSVCKHWRSLISAAYFSRRHTLRRQQPQSSFILPSSPSQFSYFNPTTEKLIPLRFNFAHAKIRQSCNGLLLLERGDVHKDYYIYNPCTGDSRNLMMKEGSFLGLYLWFDPSESPHYKVVCLRARNHLNPIDFLEIEVYDSETHAWKQGKKVHTNAHPPPNGAIYWKNCIYFIEKMDGRALCLDLEMGMCREASQENLFRWDTAGVTLLSVEESGGRFRYIARDDVTNCSVVCEIKEKGCRGKCIAKYLDFVALFSAISYQEICFVGIIRGENGEESLVFHFPGKIMAYRLSTRRVDELVDLRPSELNIDDRSLSCCHGANYHRAHQFIESLAPV